MRLSIFSFDRSAENLSATLRVAIIAVLACSIALIAAFEFGARIYVHRVSRNLSRIYQESVAASKIGGGDKISRDMLLVGNSLLLHDVDIPGLQQALKPDWSVSRYAIQSTTYYDWYYGIRGLLARGARPDIIVLCFEARHIILPGVQNEMFAYYLMQRQDLMDVSHTLKLTVADTFDLLIANTSTFYALRKDIRQVILQRILPELPQLTSKIAFSPKPPVDSEVLRTIGKERLIAIRDLVASANIRFLLLVLPPVRSDSADILKGIGRDLTVPVLVPLGEGGLDRGDYQEDGYHLNDYGRAKFTEALLPLLQEMQGQNQLQQ